MIAYIGGSEKDCCNVMAIDWVGKLPCMRQSTMMILLVIVPDRNSIIRSAILALFGLKLAVLLVLT